MIPRIFKGNNFTGNLTHWQSNIEEFNLTFSFIPGKANSVADGLLRNVAPVPLVTDCHVMLAAYDFKTHQHLDSFCTSVLSQFW